MLMVAYCRVSTDAQAEGQGLDVQEHDVRLWARRKRHRIVAVERDIGRSGVDDVRERPGLARALGRLAAGEAAGLVVWRLDRLARDVVLQETILADLHRVGLELHSVSDAEDENLADSPDDPTRALVRRILGAVAAYERDMIRLRLRAGRERKKAAGGLHGGAPPFGWQARGRELVPHPVEQVTLARMFALRAEGKSLRAIAAVLESEGHRSRSAGWHPSSIATILRRGGGPPERARISSGSGRRNDRKNELPPPERSNEETL